MFTIYEKTNSALRRAIYYINPQNIVGLNLGGGGGTWLSVQICKGYKIKRFSNMSATLNTVFMNI